MKEYLINFQKNECGINSSCWMLKKHKETKKQNKKTTKKTRSEKVFPTQISSAHYLQYQHTVWNQIRNLKLSK